MAHITLSSEGTVSSNLPSSTIYGKKEGIFLSGGGGGGGK